MGLFSFLRKNKQEASSSDSEFYSRAEADSGKTTRPRRRKQVKSTESDDPVLPEKKRARRRLVGAIALVLAAVIGLPMILDSEPKPVADDIAIQIPSKDKPSVASAPASAASHVAASAALDKKEEVIDIPPPVAVAPASASTQTTVVPKEEKQSDSKPVESPKHAAQDKAAAQTLAKTDSKHETKPAPVHKPEVANPAEKADDDTRALAILEGKADSKSTSDKKSEKIVLQVGAFTTKDKVDEVRNKLKKAGVQTYTEKVATKSGEIIRIRVGPLTSKEEASNMRTKLAKLGFDAKTVTGEH